jgi:hypothetical protein
MIRDPAEKSLKMPIQFLIDTAGGAAVTGGAAEAILSRA